MKKFIFAIGFIAAMAACSGNSVKNVPTANDSISVDTTLVDSVNSMTVDSTLIDSTIIN